MVMFAGRSLRVVPLNTMENLLCIGLGAGAWVWHLISALMPAEWFGWASRCVPNKATEDEEAEKAIVSSLSGRLGARLSQRTTLRAKIEKSRQDKQFVWGLGKKVDEEEGGQKATIEKETRKDQD